MNSFRASPRQIAALVAAYPLAWVVSGGANGFAATPLPLLAELGAEGGVASLFGHFALANRQVPLLRQNPAATILFQGPQGYISPKHVSTPTWGATWNYAVARFDVDVRFVPAENDDALHRLAAFLERDEADPWTPEHMGPRLAQMSPHIVAFRATVTGTEAKFKLGQDENAATLAEIVEGLGAGELATWMHSVNAEARS